MMTQKSRNTLLRYGSLRLLRSETTPRARNNFFAVTRCYGHPQRSLLGDRVGAVT
jgi:hypothetical protein